MHTYFKTLAPPIGCSGNHSHTEMTWSSFEYAFYCFVIDYQIRSTVSNPAGASCDSHTHTPTHKYWTVSNKMAETDQQFTKFQSYFYWKIENNVSVKNIGIG